MSDAAPVLPYAAELKRKALHLGALVVPAFIVLAGRPLAPLVLAAGTALAVAGDVARQRSPAARRWLHGVFGPIMRPEELPPPGGPVVLNGATWMAVTATLCAALLPPLLAATALVIQMIGDAAAAVVGRRLGRTRWPGSFKTVEGSAAFVVTGLAAALAVALVAPPGLERVGPAGLVAATLAGALAEVAPVPVNDNLRVPVAAGLVLLLATAL